MKNIFCSCFLLLLFISFKGFAQKEEVYLQLDKYVAWPGDTVYFKGYVLMDKRPSYLSTNLYVELFSSNGVLMSRSMFPVIQGESIGQVHMPDSLPSNNYYIRAFTRYQLNFDSSNLTLIPVSIFNKDRPFHVPLRKKTTEHYSADALTDFVDSTMWLTWISKDNVCSMLILDSSTRKMRNFTVVKPHGKDSAYMSVTPRNFWLTRQTLFPLDTSDNILELHKDSSLIARQVFPKIGNTRFISLTTDTLDLSPLGYNNWTIQFPDSLIYHASISVTDADRTPSPRDSITSYIKPYSDDFAVPIKQLDTSYVTFAGAVRKQYSNKRIKDPFSQEIMIAGSKDSTFLFTRVVTMDSIGNFRLGSLFFFDSLYLNFQINKEDDGNIKNLRLNLFKFIPPPLDTESIRNNWVDEGKQVDTTYSSKEIQLHNYKSMKTLAPATVKHWKSPRKELDNRYTNGAFSEPSMYSFDVRTERRFRDVRSYLAMQIGMQGGWMANPINPEDSPRIFEHRCVFFINEQVVDWADVFYLDWTQIAYIKVLKNDFIVDDPFIKWKTGVGGFSLVPAGSGQLKVPVSESPYEVCIYTRKDKDYRTMPGGFDENKVHVKGYDSIDKFKTDRFTVFWEPILVGNKVNFRFYNNETARRLRVCIDGFTKKGELIHYENIVSE